MKTFAFWEALKLLKVIYPDSESAAVNTGWLDMSLYHDASVVIHVGDIQLNGTFDVTFEQATDSSGTGAKTIPGLSFTQMTQAGGHSDKSNIIVIRSEDLDTNGGFNFIRVTATPGTAASEFCVTVYGSPRYKPVANVSSDWHQIIDTYK